MSAQTATAAPTAAASTPRSAAGRWASLTKMQRTLVMAGALFVLMAAVRALTDTPSMTSSQTIGTSLRYGIPIMLAGLAGLWAERVGVVNIGIEGMMILGTWFGGWGAWMWGAWAGLALAVVGGMIGGLIHAVAVVRFNVDHIISGVAINILAFGAMRYLSELAFVGEQGGGISQSPQQTSSIPRVSLPLLADGPDLLGDLEKRQWFVLSDVAGVLRGFLANMSLASLLALALVPLTWWVLWRTRFGLRVRSSGEAPQAAESLGVKVTPLRYQALAISGAFAGLGGGFLSIVLNSYYRQGLSGNRGFIGLATLIFGNWRPTGVLGGAGLFGFGTALNLVGRDALPKLFVVLAVVAVGFAARLLMQRKAVAGTLTLAMAVLFFVGFLTIDEVPEPLTGTVPYLLTLIVLATASQRLRPPAHAGKPFRPGESH